MTALANSRPIRQSINRTLTATQKAVLEMAAWAYFIVSVVTAIFVKMLVPNITILALIYLGITWPAWMIPAGITSIHQHMNF